MEKKQARRVCVGCDWDAITVRTSSGGARKAEMQGGAGDSVMQCVI